MKRKHKIVYLECASESFKYRNGLYLLIEETNENYKLCKLDKFGKPQLFFNGEYIVVVCN